MIFARHDIKQMDFQYLANLEWETLLSVSFKYLQDLKEVHDRLNQTPLNSSRPPASFPPWQAKPLAESPTVEESLPQGTQRGQSASVATVPTPETADLRRTRQTDEPAPEQSAEQRLQHHEIWRLTQKRTPTPKARHPASDA